jgi:hypothetical protein
MGMSPRQYQQQHLASLEITNPPQESVES